MKKTIFSAFICGLLISGAFAYQPTNDDAGQITTLKMQLNTITSGDMKDKLNFYLQLKTLQEQFSWYEQLTYYLNELGTHLMTQIHTERTKTKLVFKQNKQEFYNQYSSGFSKEITTADNCTGRYNTMDAISYANNFPTALTIATRYRETNCGYYLPNNGDGPFQILSKEYGTGQITEAKFLNAIQDFIDFSKAKRTQYKSKLWISLTYTGVDMTGLVNHAGLYNGGLISWNIVNPIHPNYLYDGYTQEYSWATRYGLVPKFLKVLGRELQNAY